MTVMVQLATDDRLLRPEIAKWLDFGPAQSITAAALKWGITRGMEQLFTFSGEKGTAPLGAVGLNQIDSQLRTAML